ncbi:MAG: cysteine synthase A [Bacteroidales bacterium]|nr:cysteine synthase A [Bacteroidales bacterium]MCF8390781.1 cysteine synthase A [Bacteroidales bacterium]
MKANTILETIGNSPHIRLQKLFPSNYEVWIKLEKSNPGGSIKDRIALNMIEQAEKDGLLNKDSVIIEPTSGNTGIGLALVCAVKNYRVILVMPESMSLERRKIMQAYGAEIVLTPRAEGMKGSIQKANELKNATPNAWIPSQFDNPANPAAHEKTTSREIIRDFPQGFDYLITGVGTGGHISGVGRVLKEKFPKLLIYAVEPELSAVISGGAPGPHPLQGIGAGFIPANLDTSILTESIKVTKEEAYSFTRRAALEEGIFIGISTGASLAAISKSLSKFKTGSRILTFAYDTGERYLSVDDLF